MNSAWTPYTLPGPARSYANIRVEPLGPGPWRTYTRYDDQTRMRVIGRLFCDILEHGRYLQAARYTVVQVENRVSFGLYSRYESRILVGSYIDEEADEQGLASKLDGVGLWCSNCWTDDMYGNGTGGISFPAFMRGRYYGKLGHHPGCASCEARLVPFGNGPRLADANAYVFGAVQSPVLKRAVAEVFLPLGIAEVRTARDEDTVLSAEQKEAIVAAAMAPARLAQLIERHGIERAAAVF